MDEQKSKSMAGYVAVVIVLVGAVGLGFGIRHVRNLRASLKDSPVPVSEAPPAEVETTGPVVVAEEPAPESVGPAEPAVEIVEEPVIEEPEESTVAVEAAPEPALEREPPRGEANREMFMRVFGDLNLSEEEQARMRNGFFQRFAMMSDEERQAEFARMRSMREQWEAMDEPGREAALVRIREQIEDWRRSGALEPPDLRLD